MRVSWQAHPKLARITANEHTRQSSRPKGLILSHCAVHERKLTVLFVRNLSVLLLLLALGYCQQPNPEQSKEIPKSDTWANDWAELLGQEVTLEGTAVNGKAGALLMSDDEASVAMHGLDAWPEGYQEVGDKRKRVRVTGTVILKHDLPVFIQKP